MQTFLCEPTFNLSLAHLDYKRLGKQRVEAYQILLALGDKWAWSVYKGNKTPDTYGWKNHPAVKMWKNKELALKFYYNETIFQWTDRGYKNNMPLFERYGSPDYMPKFIAVDWYNEQFITSHRCKLLQKDYNFYSQYNWSVPDNWQEINYIWPVK